MSRNRPSPLRAMRARLPRVLESALTAFLYAAGLLLPLCSALALPVGTVEVRPVKGGLTVDGLCIEAFGDRDCSIEAALAAVEVFITE